MCGRFFILMEGDDAAGREVMPGHDVQVLTADGWRVMQWGFPGFDGRRLINARAETVGVKPTFRAAFAQRRCLVPGSGFFEWQRQDGKRTKNKFRLYRTDGQMIMMAGIYNERGQFVIITQPPNEVVAPIHDRMPVIMATPELQTLWLHEDGMAEMLLTMQPDVPLRAQAERPPQDPWEALRRRKA